MTYHGWGEWPSFLDETDEIPACRGHDTELFFPVSARKGGTPNRQIAKAKAICDRCPLKAACRDWAQRQDRYLAGVWGGTTQNDRIKTSTNTRSA